VSDGGESPLPGQALVGRYRFDVPVASGGMATVWRGTDLVLGRTVAIKLLHPHLAEDPSFVERFRREAQAAARLNDQHIVAIFDSVTEGRQSALILQYVEGTTLRDRLQQGPLNTAVAAGICAQVAAALEVAHAAGIVHRDVKPANVLLCNPDTTEEAASPVPRVRVTDFGIAKALEDDPGLDLTSANTVIGTAKYLAPEQVQGGPVDGRTDLFALGVMLYEAVAGRPPWQADTDLATALGRLTADPVPIGELQPGLDPALDRVISRAIARRPEDRFQSATELRVALEALARTAASGAPTAMPGPVPGQDRQRPPSDGPDPENTTQLDEPTAVLAHGTGSRPGGRWRALLAAGLGAAVVVAGLAAWAGRNGDPPEEATTELPGTGSTVGADQDFGGVALAEVDPYSYDPFAGDGENDDLLQFAVDEDKALDSVDVWRSDCYLDNDPLPKPGFGLILDALDTTSLAGLELITRNAGWQAEVYVSDAAGSALRAQPLEDLGPPRARIDADSPTVKASLEGIEGRSVLVFFTSLAGIPPQDCFGQGQTYRLEVIEAVLYSSS
jgi:eukaryotic-like serine/threonine-protein kinase